MDLSAVVVNFNTADFARRCVRSFFAETRGLRFRGRPVEAEAIVVDNASTRDGRDALAAVEREGARLLLHGKNPGYAGGVNFGIRAARGEFVAVLNPDIEFVPGALRLLFDPLVADEGAGAVGPKTYLDAKRSVILPRNRLPRLLDHLAQTAAHLLPAACRRYALARSREAHDYWTAAEPRELDMLSGCCFLSRRAVLEGVGLFDERYPLYYEDGDLFRRLKKAGYRCTYVPAAEVVHFWSRSVATADRGEPMRRFYASQRHYFRKFYGPLGYLLYLLCQGAHALWPRGKRMRPMTAVARLGLLSEPPAFDLPRAPRRWLAEICGDPMFLLAGGVYGSGGRFEFPRSGWEGLDPSEYFVRVIDLEGFEVLGTWSVTRVRDEGAMGAPAPVPLGAAAAVP